MSRNEIGVNFFYGGGKEEKYVLMTVIIILLYTHVRIESFIVTSTCFGFFTTTVPLYGMLLFITEKKILKRILLHADTYSIVYYHFFDTSMVQYY